MKKRFFILLFLSLIFFYGSSEASQKILSLQSFRVQPYEDAIRGFKKTCDCKIKESLILESNDSDVGERIRKINPDLILAIGLDALLKVKEINEIPIVYLMVLDPASVLSGKKNITGISMNIPSEIQLRIFQKTLPDAKRIGLIFDLVNTGLFVKGAREAAKTIGVQLITKEVHSAKDVPSLISAMKADIDAFWMLPDTTVISSETVEFLVLFSIEHKIPIFTFSERFVETGALMSLSFDAFELGKRAGEMARDILSGKDIRDIPRADVTDVIISISPNMARKLGITIPDEILNKAKIVH
ncbi:MAG: ABC transporter substrate-binding protein [bacterium]